MEQINTFNQLSKLDNNYIKKYINDYLYDYFKFDDESIDFMLNHFFEGGKRIRPLISLNTLIQFSNINNHLNNNFLQEQILLCLIPEIIHNFSLILDDLPCMDNDLYRRDKKTFHHKYGIINTNLFIPLIMNKITNYIDFHIVFNKKIKIKKSNNEIKVYYFKDYLNKLIFDNIELLINGQYQDLNYINIGYDISVVYKLNCNKTGPLFSISFILGYLSTIFNNDTDNSELDKNIKDKKEIFEIEEIIISKLKELGILFGLVFQITDDILDIEQDSKDSKKAMNNICIILGLKKTINEFYKNINLLENEFKKLNIFNTNFEDLLNQLKKRIE